MEESAECTRETAILCQQCLGWSRLKAGGLHVGTHDLCWGGGGGWSPNNTTSYFFSAYHVLGTQLLEFSQQPYGNYHYAHLMDENTELRD